MIAGGLGKGKASLLGIASGAVAGLVAITPAAGLSGPMGSIVLGLVAGAVCYFGGHGVKNALGYDDALDVFGIHGVGGIIGAIGTGIVAPLPRRLRHRRVLHQRSVGDAGCRGGGHPGVDRHRLGGALQDHRPDRRPARHARPGARRSRPSRTTATRLQLKNAPVASLGDR